VAFQDLEHPSELEFGLEQKEVTIELIGGGRNVQTLGAQPKNVSWRGTFWFTTARARSQALKRMCADGKIQPVKWGADAYSVIVKEYLPKAINDFEIQYTITVVVVADKSGSYSSGSTISVDSQTQTMYQQVQTEFASLQGVDSTTTSFQSNINSIGTQLSQLGPIAQAVGPSVTTLSNLLNVTIGQVQGYVTTAQAALNASTGSLSPTTQQQYSFANRMLGNLKLIASNLAVGQAPKTVTVNGGNLYALASQYYGDPALAVNIQAANGLRTMALPQGVVVTLNIPPAQEPS
jgi:hypothetical protein